jgi:hypothetical protein
MSGSYDQLSQYREEPGTQNTPQGTGATRDFYFVGELGVTGQLDDVPSILEESTADVSGDGVSVKLQDDPTGVQVIDQSAARRADISQDRFLGTIAKVVEDSRSSGSIAVASVIVRERPQLSGLLRQDTEDASRPDTPSQAETPDKELIADELPNPFPDGGTVYIFTKEGERLDTGTRIENDGKVIKLHRPYRNVNEGRLKILTHYYNTMTGVAERHGKLAEAFRTEYDRDETRYLFPTLPCLYEYQMQLFKGMGTAGIRLTQSKDKNPPHTPPEAYAGEYLPRHEAPGSLNQYLLLHDIFGHWKGLATLEEYDFEDGIIPLCALADSIATGYSSDMAKQYLTQVAAGVDSFT